MPRRVTGVLCVEGVQTGDGRVIAEGALSWADLPLPLSWLQEEQHGDLLAGGVQVGVIDTITREGNEIRFTGNIDDAEGSDGAELIRRMEAGTASHGERQFLSIDPDDYELQVIVMETDDDEGGILLLASGSGGVPSVRRHVESGQPVLVAAAGDPDPGEDGGDSGVVVYEDAADAWLQRYTRLRIRGATACAVSAFTEAWMELDGEASPEGEGGDDEGEAVTAATAPAATARPARPPADWFAMPEPPEDSDLYVEQPDGSLAVPLTITDDGHVFGHLAAWGQCHTAYNGRCVTPPDSASAYAHFHVGETVTADGSRVATGTLFVNCDHAAVRLMASEARDHYAHAGLGWANVRAVNGEWGPWVSGAVRPHITDDQLVVLRASAPSGDWRRIGGRLELIAALSVNSPGFPIARESLVASGLADLPVVEAAMTYMSEGVQQSLVASGLVHRCAECARMRASGPPAMATADIAPVLADIRHALHRLDVRTRHLVPTARDHALARIRETTGR